MLDSVRLVMPSINNMLAESMKSSVAAINDSISRLRTVDRPSLQAAIAAATDVLESRPSDGSDRYRTALEAAMKAAEQARRRAAQQDTERLEFEESVAADLDSLPVAERAQLDADAELILEGLASPTAPADLERSITKLVGAVEKFDTTVEKLETRVEKLDTTVEKLGSDNAKSTRIAGMMAVVGVLGLLVAVYGVARDGLTDGWGWESGDPAPAPTAVERQVELVAPPISTIDPVPPVGPGPLEKLADERIHDVLAGENDCGPTTDEH